MIAVYYLIFRSKPTKAYCIFAASKKEAKEKLCKHKNLEYLQAKSQIKQVNNLYSVYAVQTIK